MAPDEPLEIALSQALARYTPRVDFPLPVETESGAGRRPKRKADSLPYMPMRDLPQLRKLLSTEAASLLETAQESQEELGEAILARLPDVLKDNWRNGLTDWTWPEGSPLARRRPVSPLWLLNVARWFSKFSKFHNSERIEALSLGHAVILTRGLGPDSVLLTDFTFWADRLSLRQVELFEKLLVEDPDEPFLRATLCWFYWRQEEHWEDILWHIRKCPESPILDSVLTYARSVPEPLYYELLKAWAHQIRSQPENIHALSNAARQFKDRDFTLSFLLYQRCSLLDPSSSEWPMALAEMVDNHADQEQSFKAIELMQIAYEREQDVGRKRHIKLDWLKCCFRNGQKERAEKMAWDLLRSSSSAIEHGLELHECNLLLGHLALDKDDLQGARTHLLAAARTPGAPTICSFGPGMCLAYRLLQHRERSVVLEYFEMCAKFWDDPRLQCWSAEIQVGGIPDFGANMVYCGLLRR